MQKIVIFYPTLQFFVPKTIHGALQGRHEDLVTTVTAIHELQATNRELLAILPVQSPNHLPPTLHHHPQKCKSSGPLPRTSGVASMEQMEQLLPGTPRATFVIRADPRFFLGGGRWQGRKLA